MIEIDFSLMRQKMNAFREFLNVEILFFKNDIHDGDQNDLKRLCKRQFTQYKGGFVSRELFLSQPFGTFWGLSCNDF